MGLSKLPPAPWTVGFDGQTYYVPGVITGAPLEVCQAVCLMRNAEDVMMRRGWNPELNYDGLWSVSQSFHEDHWMCEADGGKLMEWPDPFTALVEADRWYRENVEKQPQPL